MRTHNIPSCCRKTKRYPYYAFWLGAMSNPQWVELPLSRTYFHGSKGVRAIEVLLYLKIINRIVRNDQTLLLILILKTFWANHIVLIHVF